MQALLIRIRDKQRARVHAQSMKLLLACVSLALVVSSQGCSPNEAPSKSAHATGHESHDMHAGDAAAPMPPDGRLWPTDEPLRSAMTRIRAAVEQTAPAYERKELRAADAEKLAVTVEESVAYMVANCKLSPEADAALHVLIGRMMSAAAALRSDPASDAGVPQLLAVLHDYQAAFEHPGWPPLHAA
jgi:hypothetical protein